MWEAGSLIVVLFCIGLGPSRWCVLFFKLFGKDEKKSADAAPPPLSGQIPWQPDTAGADEPAQPSKARQAARKVTKSPCRKRPPPPAWLKIAGIVVAAVGLIACWEPLSILVWLREIDTWYLEDLLTAAAMVVAGGAMLVGGRLHGPQSPAIQQVSGGAGRPGGHGHGGARPDTGLSRRPGGKGPAEDDR